MDEILTAYEQCDEETETHLKELEDLFKKEEFVPTVKAYLREEIDQRKIDLHRKKIDAAVSATDFPSLLALCQRIPIDQKEYGKSKIIELTEHCLNFPTLTKLQPEKLYVLLSTVNDQLLVPYALLGKVLFECMKKIAVPDPVAS